MECSIKRSVRENVRPRSGSESKFAREKTTETYGRMVSSPKMSLMSGSCTTVNFVDVTDPKQVVNEIDLDNVVLTERQKLKLAAQCLRTAIFWQLYAMQFCSIRKCRSNKLAHVTIIFFSS